MLKCPTCHGTGKIPDGVSEGREMRQLRLEIGLRLRRMAKAMGISPVHLSNMERGKRRFTPEQKANALKIINNTHNHAQKTK